MSEMGKLYAMNAISQCEVPEPCCGGYDVFDVSANNFSC